MSLALSDLGVGLLVQPIYTASFVEHLLQSKSSFGSTCEVYGLLVYFVIVLLCNSP